MAAPGPSRTEDEDAEMMCVEYKHEGSDHDCMTIRSTLRTMIVMQAKMKIRMRTLAEDPLTMARATKTEA